MDNEKHVDESWKNDVAKGKEGCADDCSCGHDHGAEGAEGAEGDVQVNFFNYIMSMGYQAMIFLGEVPHPATGKQEKNVQQAKFLIDTLLLIREKTKGNLNPQEESFLSGTLYELQMKFVEAGGKPA